MSTSNPMAAYLVGGSPCAGKSTIAARLAHTHGLALYAVDDWEADHMRRIDSTRHPTMHRYTQMEWETIWMRPPQHQVREEIAFYRERLHMVREDLCTRRPGRPWLLEGAAFLPECCSALGLDRTQVVFLIPTRAFAQTHYRRRAFVRDILAQCSKPEQAFANWMERDTLFGQWIEAQARRRGYPVRTVDGRESLEQTEAGVRRSLGLADP